MKKVIHFYKQSTHRRHRQKHSVERETSCDFLDIQTDRHTRALSLSSIPPSLIRLEIKCQVEATDLTESEVDASFVVLNRVGEVEKCCCLIELTRLCSGLDLPNFPSS